MCQLIVVPMVSVTDSITIEDVVTRTSHTKNEPCPSNLVSTELSWIWSSFTTMVVLNVPYAHMHAKLHYTIREHIFVTCNNGWRSISQVWTRKREEEIKAIFGVFC